MKITIITVCYNAEKEIERTIRSVLNQSYCDMEYIIVDGGSKDDTIKKVKHIVKEYPARSVVIISEPDNGIYDAMNKGIKHASGEWINMMNAGDTFADNNVLYNIFKKEIPENIKFIYSDFYKLTSFGKYFRVHKECNEHTRSLVHQSTIYKKELHEIYGYYVVTSKIIVSDLLFFLQIPLEHILKTDTVIAKYEGNGVSETGSWCTEQGLCANVVYRHISFWSIYLKFLKWKLKHLVPLRIREYLRLKSSGVII